jgi:hypothetical protein
MAASRHSPGFRYTTHSWLLSLFLDCPPGMGLLCPNATAVEDLKAAISKGYITWHAAPFNPEYETFDAPLLEFALGLTHQLDEQFGLPHKKTISLVGGWLDLEGGRGRAHGSGQYIGPKAVTQAPAQS